MGEPFLANFSTLMVRRPFSVAMKLTYDPKHNVPYGYWTCDECNANFYGGGPALHSKDCPVRSQEYESCNYHFGPKEVEKAVECAAYNKDESARTPLGCISVKILKEKFPEII